MTQMTTGQARIIDPILTEVARGYRQSDFIGDKLFPITPVSQRAGNIVQFGREEFKQYSTGRTPGSNTKRITPSYSSIGYALEDHSIEELVPYEIMEDASAVPGIDMAKVAIMKAQAIISLRKELAQATLATTGGNYGAGMTSALSGTAQWNDYANSDPLRDIENAKEAVRAKIGLRPTTIAIGAAVAAHLRNHPDIVDRVKYTGRDTPTTALLADLFGVREVLVGDAVYVNNSDVQVDAWGKNVIVAFTPTANLAAMGMPSFGFTYQLRGYPIVELPYQDRNAKSWIYPVTDVCAPVIAGNTAAYLYTSVVS